MLARCLAALIALAICSTTFCAQIAVDELEAIKKQFVDEKGKAQVAFIAKFDALIAAVRQKMGLIGSERLSFAKRWADEKQHFTNDNELSSDSDLAVLGVQYEMRVSKKYRPVLKKYDTSGLSAGFADTPCYAAKACGDNPCSFFWSCYRSRPEVCGLEERIRPAFIEFLDPHPAPGNQFGATVVALSTGNVVITAPFDDAGGIDAGAVYLFDGATGALISTLIGSHANDNIGSTGGGGTGGGVLALSNGNYVVSSGKWDNGAVVDAGAVTWGSGVNGVSGVVSPANSLVGGTANDKLGSAATVKALTNGNYAVACPNWDNGTVVDAGAVTWGNGSIGVKGVISAANSLVGSTVDDQVGGVNGLGLRPLSNGNYVVSSFNWDNGAVADVGAVTWANGATGITGPVSAANSLIGSAGAAVGGVHALRNSNYLAKSAGWENGPAQAGAVTWCNGSTGFIGVVSPANSLVGSQAKDHVGTLITELSNGNYVVCSDSWSNGAVTDVGAVTWCNGSTGRIGVVSTTNSLVGSTAGDRIGAPAARPLINGNYVVLGNNWDNGAVVNAGAVTWGNGTTGITGVVSVANSLVGSSVNEGLGSSGIMALTNGNYVVPSRRWDNGAVTDVGAVTWGNGTTGITGVVSAANSLVGSTTGDQVGTFVRALTNGNYVVSSTDWDNGAVADVGAVTWCNGATGTTGVVRTTNSLVGSSMGDRVGFVTVLANGNYVVNSQSWDNGAVSGAGAVTWANGTTGLVGVVSPANSLVGTKLSDGVGTSVKALSNGNYVVLSVNWDNGATTNVGAATWGNGASPISGVISAANSAIGSVASSDLQQGAVLDNVNGTFFVRFLTDGGGRVRVGSQATGFGAAGSLP